MGRPIHLHFASDNYSGICPEALAALEAANAGHALPYGEDPWTAEACDLFREIFETPCEAFFVFSGTGSNGLALATLCQPYHSIICHRYAHAETDECGAPEFFSHGTKILLSEGCGGKLTPQSIENIVTRRSDIHYPKPRAVTVTQATELGTVYTPAELRAISGTTKAHGLKLHMDGARFANAVVSLGVPPRDITAACGVDVLCFGGSKNGLAVGEAVIFFDLGAAAEFDYRCKQAGQLAAKMRFIAAQWVGLLKTGAWKRHAEHANRCASLLAAALSAVPEVETVFPVEANAVFVKMPERVLRSLRAKGWHFYTFIGPGEARLMCSWDTTEEAIRAFVADLKASIIETR